MDDHSNQPDNQQGQDEQHIKPDGEVPPKVSDKLRTSKDSNFPSRWNSVEGNVMNIAGNFNQISTSIPIGGDVARGSDYFSSGLAIGSFYAPVDAFGAINKQIDGRPSDPDVDKQEIRDIVGKIAQEAAKCSAANENKLRRWLRDLAEIAPDIFASTAAALSEPNAGFGEAIGLIVADARRAAGQE